MIWDFVYVFLLADKVYVVAWMITVQYKIKGIILDSNRLKLCPMYGSSLVRLFVM